MTSTVKIGEIQLEVYILEKVRTFLSSVLKRMSGYLLLHETKCEMECVPPVIIVVGRHGRPDGE
jgi:hypothetical protein